MTENVHYACPVCSATYDPQTAAALGFRCHDANLERVSKALRSRWTQVASSVGRLSALARPAASEPGLFEESGGQQVLQVIPPRMNQRNAPVVKALLASIGVGEPFSLEIAADSNGRRYLVRGRPATLEHIAHQIRAAYDQAECVRLDAANDPARLLSHALEGGPPGERHSVVAGGRMKLRRPEFFPLRTYDDLTEGDPILPLLGGFAGLGDGELALAQIVMTPAPDNWADLYQATAQEMTPQERKMSPPGQARLALLALGVIWGIVALALLFAVGGQPLGAVSLAILTAAVWGGLMWAGQKITLTMNADAKIIKLKVQDPGFHAEIRLWTAAASAEDARRLLGRIAGAYRSFNAADGNALELVADGLPSAPQDLSRERLRRASVLNTRELATLWHLPLGEYPDQVRQGLYQRFLPIPSTVNEPGSIPIGSAVKAGQRVTVALSALAASHNILILGKTQKGKTTVAGFLAESIMTEREHALVVISPHRDFADGLLGLVPESRADDVIYIDLGREDRSVGLNLLDAALLKMKPDKIVSDLVSLGRTIWKDNWGPRMESALSYAAQTLAYANLKLKPTEQFTLMDMPYLYLDKTFRDNVLVTFISQSDILDWWKMYFEENLTNNFRQEIINPVLTKIHAFSRAGAVRNVISQSRSTINVRDAVASGKLLLIHTASGEIGADIGGFMGAVMLNYLNAVVREQIGLERRSRARVTVIIDEFQSIPGVDYGALLSELLKMGANFILANQALAQLDAIHPALKGAVFSNIDTLVTFQTSGEDADYLYNELDQKVSAPDLTNLRPHECYLKTIDQRGERLPVMHVETREPGAGAPDLADRIRERMARYTVDAQQVEANLAEHMHVWHQDPARLAQAVQRALQTDTTEPAPRNVYADYGKFVSRSNDAGQDAMTRRVPPPSA